MKKKFKLRYIFTLTMLILFSSCNQPSINNQSQEEADDNAFRCYEIAMMNQAGESLIEEDNELVDGCIFLPVSGQYWTYEKYGGSKNIREVFWFYNRDNWKITDEGKISNFDELEENTEIYGIFIND